MKTFTSFALLLPQLALAELPADTSITAAEGTEPNTVDITASFPASHCWFGYGYGAAPSMPGNRFIIFLHNGQDVVCSEREASSRALPTPVEGASVVTKNATISDGTATVTCTVDAKEVNGVNLTDGQTVESIWALSKSDCEDKLTQASSFSQHATRGSFELTVGDKKEGEDKDGNFGNKVAVGLTSVLAVVAVMVVLA